MQTWSSTMAFRSFHFFSKASPRRLTSIKLMASIRPALAMQSSFRMRGPSSNPCLKSNYLIKQKNNRVDKLNFKEYKYISDQVGLRLVYSAIHLSGSNLVDEAVSIRHKQGYYGTR